MYLGIRLFRAGGTLSAEPRTGSTLSLKMAGHAWLVTALNPKSLTFFVAFLPQFLDHGADFLSQMLVLESTFLVLASSTHSAMRSPPRGPAMRLQIRARSASSTGAGGTLLVGAGIATAAVRSVH